MLKVVITVYHAGKGFCLNLYSFWSWAGDLDIFGFIQFHVSATLKTVKLVLCLKATCVWPAAVVLVKCFL